MFKKNPCYHLPAIFKAVLTGQSWTFLFCRSLPGDQAWRPLIHTCLSPVSAHVSNTFMMTSPRWPSTALWGSSLKIYMTLSSFWDSKLWRVTEKRVTCVSDSFVYYSPHPFVLFLSIFLHLWTLNDCRAFWRLWDRNLKTMNPKELQFLQEFHAGRERWRQPYQDRNFVPHRNKDIPTALSKQICMCSWHLHYLFYSSVTLGQAR